MDRFYKLEEEYLDIMGTFSASDKACEETGHPHGGWWFASGDKEPRLEWLDKHIALC